MKTKKILWLFIVLLMICGLFSMTCKKLDCVGDGECYVERSNKRKGCGDKSCVAYKDVVFQQNENRKNCSCY